MFKKLFDLISAKFKTSSVIEEKKDEVMDLGETITVPEELIAEKKKRGGRKKKINDPMTEIID